MRFLLTLLLFISLLSACTSDESIDNNTMTDTYFFDLSEYFNEQVTDLQEVNIQKTASINGEEEVQMIAQPDFEQELQLFIASDINRISWLDKYDVDSLQTANGELKQLTYTALEDKLRTRKVVIDFKQDEVTYIKITNATDNVIAQTKQELNYTPRKGYNIKSFQDILFSNPRTMEVKVLFQS